MGSGGDVEAPGDGSSGDEKAPESSDSEDDGSGSAHDEVKEPERRSGKARGAAVNKGKDPNAVAHDGAAGGRGRRRSSASTTEAPRVTVVTEVPDFVAIPVVKFHLRKEAATQAAYQVVIALYVQQAFHGKIGEIQDIKGFVALASDIVFAAFYLGAAATITGAYYCRAPARRVRRAAAARRAPAAGPRARRRRNFALLSCPGLARGPGQGCGTCGQGCTVEPTAAHGVTT